MRSVSKLIASALFLLAGMFTLQHSAMALTTINATACKPYGASNAGGLYSYVNGVYNGTSSTMYVVCPLTRIAAPAANGNMGIWVDGNSASGSTYCAVYSYNYTGAYMGSTSFSATGNYTRAVYLPASKVPTFSSQSVYCALPAYGRLYDVEPF